MRSIPIARPAALAAAGALAAGLALAPVGERAQPAGLSLRITLPAREGSLKFAVVGDTGTGGRAQYQVAERMAEVLDYRRWHRFERRRGTLSGVR